MVSKATMVYDNWVFITESEKRPQPVIVKKTPLGVKYWSSSILPFKLF